MDRDEAEKITNDPELLASKLYIAQGNSIYPYEELGEASKELFRPLARYVIELLSALTGKRLNCIEIGHGHGLCDMCAAGEPKLCRYVNTISSMVEIDRLRHALTAQGQEVDLHAKIMNIPIDDVLLSQAIGECYRVYNIRLEDVSALEYIYKLGCRDTRHAAAEIVANASVPQGQERPDGPGEYYVTIKLNLEKCVAQCANEHCPRLWSPDITMTGCDDSDGICIGDIEGTWRKVG